MRYLSVCSGIEAATAAWHPLGWKPAAFSEIEAFPRAVLAHHYPAVPLHGDFTTIKAGQYGPIDILVGGTPCQDFSVAGLRAGIAGDRGNLTLEFLRLAARTKPRWIVWENVPGVLSSDGGRALGAFLGGLGQLGYGFAYRVLDAQYFGLAQRRSRVFVVGHLGDWRRAAAVLFERESLLCDHPPRWEAGERPAAAISARTKGGGGLGTDFDCDGGLISGTLDTRLAAHISGMKNESDFLVVPEGSLCLNAGGMRRQDSETLIAHSLRAEGFDASEDGTGRGTPIVPISFLSDASFAEHGINIAGTLRTKNRHAIAFSSKDHGDKTGPRDINGYTTGVLAFDTNQITSPTCRSNPKAGDPCFTLTAKAYAPVIVTPAVAFTQNSRSEERYIGGDGQIVGALAADAGAQQQNYVAFDMRGRKGGAQFEGPHNTANIRAASGGSSRSYVAATAVRRLTPKECCRLQGFPDTYLDIIYRGKPAADGNKYKALGNSMAVPVMAWIGRRLALVDAA